jgi:cell division inhibitor SepF
MGFLDIFKKKKIESIVEDDEEIIDENAPVVEPEVSIEGQEGKSVEMKICKPKNFEQSLSAIDYMVAGRTVILNLEDVDRSVCRRIMDFISGAAYALNLSINKTSATSYIIAQNEVGVSGEIFETPQADEEYFTI